MSGIHQAECRTVFVLELPPEAIPNIEPASFLHALNGYSDSELQRTASKRTISFPPSSISQTENSTLYLMHFLPALRVVDAERAVVV